MDFAAFWLEANDNPTLPPFLALLRRRYRDPGFLAVDTDLYSRRAAAARYWLISSTRLGSRSARDSFAAALTVCAVMAAVFVSSRLKTEWSFRGLSQKRGCGGTERHRHDASESGLSLSWLRHALLRAMVRGYPGCTPAMRPAARRRAADICLPDTPDFIALARLCLEHHEIGAPADARQTRLDIIRICVLYLHLQWLHVYAHIVRHARNETRMLINRPLSDAASITEFRRSVTRLGRLLASSMPKGELTPTKLSALGILRREGPLSANALASRLGSCRSL